MIWDQASLYSQSDFRLIFKNHFQLNMAQHLKSRLYNFFFLVVGYLKPNVYFYFKKKLIQFKERINKFRLEKKTEPLLEKIRDLVLEVIAKIGT